MSSCSCCQRLKALLDRPNLGLLLLRVIVGVLMIGHGVAKFQGGEQTLTFVGKSMGLIGITAWPLFWGTLAAGVEVLGGLCVALGIFFRPACALLLGVMAMATFLHISKGDSFLNVTAHAFTTWAVFLGFLFTGPGRLGLCKKCCCGSGCGCQKQ